MSNYIQQLDNILKATGDNVLQNAGSISHEQAVEKALAEYKKYQQKTLSEVEKSYLESLKMLEDKSKNIK
jgi:hypothetical protein